MSRDTSQRAHRLVEELRAEVDFEIDDVIANIIRNLPEEYFRSLAHDDQLTHLKALLAISICNLKRELTLRSDDDRHIAVVARQNYPGLLAKIIAGLPDEQPLVGAKIFTSKTHDFIIDLFEFKSPFSVNRPRGLSQLEFDDTVNAVAKMTGNSREVIVDFVSSYPPGSRALESPTEICEHYLAYCESRDSQDVAVRWTELPGKHQSKITVSAGSMRARELFLATAKFLADHEADIDQAFLDDFPSPGQENHIAVASFLVLGKLADSPTTIGLQMADFLRSN